MFIFIFTILLLCSCHFQYITSNTTPYMGMLSYVTGQIVDLKTGIGIDDAKITVSSDDTNWGKYTFIINDVTARTMNDGMFNFPIGSSGVKENENRKIYPKADTISVQINIQKSNYIKKIITKKVRFGAFGNINEEGLIKDGEGDIPINDIGIIQLIPKEK